MRIIDLYKTARPVFSFEFFPPKTDKGSQDLRRTIEDLKSLAPGFVSVTYGAGGSTRDRTIELVSYIKNEVGLEAMAHLTCVGSSRGEITATLDRLEAEGIENIIALRGDPPAGEEHFVVHPDGLEHAADLVALIREQKRPFSVAAAGYPETHTEAPSPEADLRNLVTKVAAGVDVVITQLFFDNRSYFDFVDKVRGAGVTVPIVPGIMPITNVSQVERFTTMCGATIPQSLWKRLDEARESNNEVIRLGVEHATEQCRALLAGGAPGIHFYTLNRSRSTSDIVKKIRTES